MTRDASSFTPSRTALGIATAEKVAHVSASLSGLSLWLRKKSRGRFGWRGDNGWGSRRLGYFGGDLEFDTTCQNSALFDGESAGEDVSLDDGGLTQIDTTCGLNVAGELTEDDDVANTEIGANARIGPNGEAAFR